MTGYNTIPGQTDDTPCLAASGANLCGRTDAVACPRTIALGTRVEIRGESYICEDRLARKFDSRFDISCDRNEACPPQVTGWVVVKVFPGERLQRPIPAQSPPPIYTVANMIDTAATTIAGPTADKPGSCGSEATKSAGLKIAQATTTLREMAKSTEAAVAAKPVDNSAPGATAAAATKPINQVVSAAAQTDRFHLAVVSVAAARTRPTLIRLASARPMAVKPVRVFTVLHGRARSGRLA